METRILTLQQEEANLRHKGDYEGALRVLDKMLAIDPFYSPALNNKAAILMMRGAYREAIPIIEKAVKADPTNGQASNNLGLAFQRTGEPKLAVRNFERALELGYSHEGVRYNLGLAYFVLGMIDEALDEWQKVLRGNPLYMPLLNDLYRLGQAAGLLVPGQTDLNEAIIDQLREKLKTRELTIFPSTDGGETLYSLSAARKQGA